MKEFDNCETTEDIKEAMGLEEGDAFKMNSGDLKVVNIDMRVHPKDRDSLTVTDPTINHPQDARSGNWGLPIFNVFESWIEYEVIPTQITTKQ